MFHDVKDRMWPAAYVDPARSREERGERRVSALRIGKVRVRSAKISEVQVRSARISEVRVSAVKISEIQSHCSELRRLLLRASTGVASASGCNAGAKVQQKNRFVKRFGEKF